MSTATLRVNNTTAGMSGDRFRVLVSNNAGPDAVSSAAILIIAIAPSISVQPAAQSVVAGANVTFTIAASGTPAPSYQWMKNSTVIVGATNSSLLLLNARLIDAGSYSVVISNTAGSITSNAATLVVNVPVAPAITSANSTVFVVGQPGIFTITALGAPAPTFAASELPPWCGLNTITGVLSGTPPNVTGAPFAILLTASNGVVPSATQSFTLNVQTVDVALRSRRNRWGRPQASART